MKVMKKWFSTVHRYTQCVPNQGGSLGGTLLTIEGSGFGINQDDLEGDIDGIPCSIESFSQSAITCTTGRPPDGSPALSNATLSYPSVQSGYRFKGDTF